QDVQDMPTHPSDFFTPLDLLLKRTQMPLNLRFQVLDRTIVHIDEAEQFSQQEAVMLSHFSCESGPQLLLAGMHTGMHSLGQAHGIAFSSTHGIQNGSSR